MTRSLNLISGNSYKCTARVRDLGEIQFRDLMNQDPPTHWVLFLSCDVCINMFPLKLFIFIWYIMNYFFIVHVVATSSKQVKCSISRSHDVTVKTNWKVTMGRWHCLVNYIMSQWVGDVVIDTKQSCDQQPSSFTQYPGKPGSLKQNSNGRKTWIFYLKTWT